MKLLRPGERQKERDPVWVGLEVTCPSCGMVGILEKDDPVKITLQARCVDGEIKIVFNCPECGSDIGATFRPSEIKRG